jgi:hypothetical protein
MEVRGPYLWFIAMLQGTHARGPYPIGKFMEMTQRRRWIRSDRCRFSGLNLSSQEDGEVSRRLSSLAGRNILSAFGAIVAYVISSPLTSCSNSRLFNLKNI